MFSLTNPWFWVVLVALVLGGTAAGFVKGIEWEQGKNARSQVESLVKVIKTSKLVIQKDNAIVNSLEADKVQLRGELYDVRTEFDKLREAFNKRDCSLPEHTLQLLNRARGATGATPGAGKPDATVRALTPPPGWAAGGGGKPDDR